MRFFPGARRPRPARRALGTGPSAHRSPRSVALVAALAVAAGVLVPTAYADGHHHRSHHHTSHQLKARQHQVHGRIGQVSGDLDQVSHRVARLTARLGAAQHRLSAARTGLERVQGRLGDARRLEQRLDARLATAQQRLKTATVQVAAAQRRADAQRAAARSTALGLTTDGDPRLAVIGSYLHSHSVDEIMTLQTLDDVVATQQTSSLTALENAEQALADHRADVARARDKVASSKAAAQRNVRRIGGLVAQARAKRKRVHTLVLSIRDGRRRAVRARRADRATLKRLNARETAIKRRILALAARDGNRHVRSTGGMFLPPVAHSYITSPYGWREHPIYHYWGLHDGDDLHAPCGTPELAIGPGKVVSEYYSSVWGHRLYLDLGRINGHGYVAIYNHISSYRARVGERVGSGETIARAGTTGWSTACHLHFTLMRDGKTVNPAPYIGM